MTSEDMGIHRARLLDLRARLQGEMTQMADAALNGHRSDTSNAPTHTADLGSDSFEQEMTLNLMGNEKEVLDQIDEALKRLEAGSFGLCEACGIEIPAARLEAIPYAAQCVRCASRRERNRDL
jgi:DnaK suppressor protein